MKNPNITLAPCKSSRIHAHGHCPETNTLRVQFKGKGGAPGAVYQYEGFTADEYAAMCGAESVGRHFGAHIQGAMLEDGVTPKYAHSKFSDAPEPEAAPTAAGLAPAPAMGPAP